MLNSCIALLAVALNAGHVVSIPSGTPLVAAGRLNWALQDSLHIVKKGTRGIVTRVAPEGVAGVVEVKVDHKTSRLYWLEAVGLTPVLPPGANRAGEDGGRASASTSSRLADNVLTGDLTRPRRKFRPNFTQVDAVLSGLMRSATAGGIPDFTGMMIVHPEVFHVPSFDVPIFSVPVYNVPVFTVPIYSVPVYNVPVHDVPVF